jgi:hypothetical protein
MRRNTLRYPAKARGLDALLTGLVQIKADEQRA